jgi:hypothetical protein
MSAPPRANASDALDTAELLARTEGEAALLEGRASAADDAFRAAIAIDSKWRRPKQRLHRDRAARDRPPGDPLCGM